MAPTTQVVTSEQSNGVQSKSKVRPTVKANPNLSPNKLSIRGVVGELLACANPAKPLISLGVGDSASYECFSKGKKGFNEAVVATVSSAEFDCYAHPFGFPFARRAVANYLQCNLQESDVYLTSGCTQALQVCLTVLASPNCNVLLPHPGFPPYESACDLFGIEARYYNFLPDKSWELDLEKVRLLADSNTVGIVVINPNNPCGAVYDSRHLQQIAKTARDLNIPIIADEVYGHMVFGDNKFVRLATFSHLAPIITIGSLSKRWMLPGWRLGWVAISDPHGTLKQVKEAVGMLMNVNSGPASVIQAAAPAILSDAHEEFHKNVLTVLESSANTLYERIEQIESLKCHSRPQGSMFMMVEVDTTRFHGISNDMDFAKELMKEESVLVMPGTVVGLKNWVRLFFGAPAELLNEACDRIKSFCERRSSTKLIC